MTAVATGSVHDLSAFVVGDLTLAVAPPADRRTIEVVVERDASLVLKAPPGVSVERAGRFVADKRRWIYRKLAEKDAVAGPPILKQFVEGEGFAYLGRSYRLTLTAGDGTSAVRLERGRFHLPAAEADRGAAAMRRWYTDVGGQWLRRRIGPWAARSGEDAVAVEVRDLGYRWGSAPQAAGAPRINSRGGVRSADQGTLNPPAGAPPRINIHWAALQLPPNLIDYVLVHELAHLHEANHTPAFWAIVGRLMPGYEAHKANLAAIGKDTWLGAVAGGGATLASAR
ncbi:MAG: SprT family zinc-dependent metalloprotease [bacterium]|nr:SprT family zinc-dependent metalloprotease [bacterium]